MDKLINILEHVIANPALASDPFYVRQIRETIEREKEATVWVCGIRNVGPTCVTFDKASADSFLKANEWHMVHMSHVWRDQP